MHESKYVIIPYSGVPYVRYFYLVFVLSFHTSIRLCRAVINEGISRVCLVRVALHEKGKGGKGGVKRSKMYE